MDHSFRRGNITLTDHLRNPIEANHFLRLINPPVQSTSSQSPDPEPNGASVRWAVAIDENGNPQLVLQGLPTAAKNLQKKFFHSDNSVSVSLGSYPLQADFFTGSFAKGFVPTFFSPVRAQALQFLVSNPAKAKEIVTGINARFLRMEHLSLAEATAYLKARKLRAPKGTPAFPIPSTRKRGRQPAVDISESGMVHTKYISNILMHTVP